MSLVVPEPSICLISWLLTLPGATCSGLTPFSWCPVVAAATCSCDRCEFLCNFEGKPKVSSGQRFVCGRRGTLKTVTSLPSTPKFREASDTFKVLRHVMRAIWSVRPNCSHRRVSPKETPLKPVQSLKHTTENSAEQTVMRTKWFKHIAI